MSRLNRITMYLLLPTGLAICLAIAYPGDPLMFLLGLFIGGVVATVIVLAAMSRSE